MATVGFIIDEMFEDAEFRIPYDALRKAGHNVVIIGIEADKQLEGKQKKETIRTETAIEDIDADTLDALVIPGGYSPDHLRANDDMVQLVRDIYVAGKPLAAICHGPWMLAEADVLDGMTVTSFASIKTDLRNAGADWVDKDVVEDDNIITSRKPDDLPAFVKVVLKHLGAAANDGKNKHEQGARP